ncbi:MAG: menaquinone-dependent protoporphyrinogen IX dehydrogenase [Gammaproteobacteria bacterium]|nr:menaquinone-dependent protoporphyrinogen IX dehydrogenase [Gammaproteobacteria bacterium]
MARILIAYSTTDGHTREICERLRQVVEQQGQHAELLSLAEETPADLERFDKIVIGASIRNGKHNPDVYQFIQRSGPLLDSRPNAFFTVNLVARKPAKNQPETNPYLKKFLAEISWRPRELAVFAGKIDYPRYKFWERSMIRLIMWITGGPTDPKTVEDFTDWQQVEAFGRRVGEM